METNQILPFCAELLRTFAEPLGPLGAALASIGTSLQGFLALLHQSEFVVPAENIQTMFDQWNRLDCSWVARPSETAPDYAYARASQVARQPCSIRNMG